MSQQADLINSDIDAYLAEHQRKELLRFFTCGNVDDGKSTLIGRLLHDQHKIYADQLAAVCADSVKSGTTGAGKIDLALLVDGLQAEREQGITIDVAYRYFSTSIRKFIIADTPGHEQYTRNMATGASTCHLAVILIDARYGVQTQTKRHSYIASLLGIKHTIIAINKMDLVGYSESIYAEIQQDYLNFSACLQMHDCHFIPMSALDGDNVVDKGDNMAWYGGKTLLETLNTVEIACDLNYSDTRFPVQYVNRPSADFRGFCGTLAGGVLRQGDEITALPSGKSSRIKRIVTDGGDLEVAYPGAALTITLQDEIDISRGDMLVAGDNPPKITDTLDAMVVWMHETPLQANRQYIVKLATRNCNATLAVHFCQDINTLAQHPADQLHLNEIGSCQLNLSAPVVCDSYQQNKTCGSFIIIDRLSNMTVGAGMVSAAADTLTAAAVSHAERAQRDNQTAAVILLDGCDLTKTQQLERKLFTNGHIVTVVPNPSTEILVALKNAGLICLVHENNGLHDITIDGTATLAAMYQALKEHKIIG